MRARLRRSESIEKAAVSEVTPTANITEYYFELALPQRPERATQSP